VKIYFSLQNLTDHIDVLLKIK